MNQCKEWHQSIYSTHVICNTVQHEHFYYLFEDTNNIFLVGIILTGKRKFLLNNLCVDVDPKNSWAHGEVILWLFFFVFQMI